jgi:phosphoglycerate dehydrogenase-like enzyme
VPPELAGRTGPAGLALVLSSFTDAWLARLQAIAPDLRIEQQPMFATVDDLPPALWREVEVLFTFRAFPTREQAPRLRWIQLNSAGAEAALSRSTYLDSTVQLTNLSGIHAVPIAEHVFTVLLAWRRRVPRMLEWQSEAFWPRQDEVRRVMDFDELHDQTLGVVGYGSIGRHVARIARAFGMRVLALHRGDDHRDHGYVVPGTGDPEGTLPERFFHPRELLWLLAQSDVVVLALPNTAATESLIDEAALRAMKPSAFLVNVGRGNAVDELALQRALAEGWLAGAALDVVRHEPLPADHWLWQAPNVMVTPHVSGISPRYEERSAELFAENLRRYVAGVPLLNLVEPTRGY